MIDWIFQHYQDILTIVGALYTIALVIVKLTPTPKDDAVLTDTATVVGVLCKVFGLDSRQGVNIKPKEAK